MLKIVKPKTAAEKATQTTMDTIEVTRAVVNKWLNPPFQRPLRVNEKVRLIAEQIKQSEVLPGIVTLGVMGGQTYLLDGQHRREAFLLSEVEVGYCDVRVHHFDSMAEMGREFVELNSRIVNPRPDDMLRGLEGSNPALSLLRKQCPFVGYDMVRRGPNSPLLSMSLVLRAWQAAKMEVPQAGGKGAVSLAEDLTVESAAELASFLKLALEAWGRDHEYRHLWAALNLTIVMWLYRRVVLTDDKRYLVSREVFKKAMMSLSADHGHLAWLHGRTVGGPDKSPAYSRIKAIMARRAEHEVGRKIRWPQPAWAKS